MCYSVYILHLHHLWQYFTRSKPHKLKLLGTCNWQDQFLISLWLLRLLSRQLSTVQFSSSSLAFTMHLLWRLRPVRNRFITDSTRHSNTRESNSAQPFQGFSMSMNFELSILITRFRNFHFILGPARKKISHLKQMF